MKQLSGRISAAVMALLLALTLLPQAVLAQNSSRREAALRPGYDVATIHYTDDGGSEQMLPFTQTDSGYAYTLPEGVSGEQVTVEYFSTTRWDGAVDISWYNDTDTEFTLTHPAQLAGLAALVAGQVSAETSRWRIKGDISRLTCEKKEDASLVGAGGGNKRGTLYLGSAEYDFADKTVKLACDMDMGGAKNANGVWSGPNWTPIGGRYAMDITVTDPAREADAMLSESYFNGTLDGQGHRITNLYCHRFSALGYGYSWGVGLIGNMGTLYDGEEAPKNAPTVRNLSVSGSVYARRAVAGIVGRVGEIPTGVRVESCANHADIQATDSKGVGGVVAAGWGTGYIVNCYNTGSVTNEKYACPAGGICGNNRGMNIYACYNVGEIESLDGRGRAIGGHDEGTYTVANCYFLTGSDNDPASNGWYKGTGANCTVDIASMSRSQMQSAELVSRLNANGEAFVYRAGSYPILFWEQAGYAAGTHTVTVRNGMGISVSASAEGKVKSGAVLYLGYTETPGYAFRAFTANGEKLVGDYCTVTRDTVISATAESLLPGTMLIPESSVYTISVTKNGVIYENGAAKAVTDYPVKNGDPIYEGDVFTAKATLKDGTAPADPDYCYDGVFDYTFAYQEEGGTSKTSRQGTFTATASQAALKLTAASGTIRKVWSMMADTAWYSGAETEFTLTSARQLAGLAKLVREGNSFAGKTVRLGADISLLKWEDGGKPLWDGIGSADGTAFSGHFDGGGHTVSGMQAESSGYAALFLSARGAVIENLTVTGSAKAGSGLGGIVSRAEDTTIRGCVSRVELIGGYSTGKSGGIVGQISGNSLVEGCVNYGFVSDGLPTGGLAGQVEDSTIVRDCVNFGSVSGSGSGGGLGGLVGKLNGGQLLRCANYGTVKAIASWYTGGIVGVLNSSSASVTDCYNAAAVSGGHSTYTRGGTGGLVGFFGLGSLTNCYNCGAVTLGQGLICDNLGGAIGYDMRKSSAKIENVFFLDSSCASATTAERADAVSAAELATESFLAKVNQNGCFVLRNGQYPELKMAADRIAEDNASCGDLDGDGEVTMRDLLLLRRYIAGGYDDEILLSAADVNGDGRVDMQDLILLRQYLAGGYGVTLGARGER